MLNYLWAGMIAVGIIYGVFSGNMEGVTNGALDSAKEAISLCLSMCGVMALWMGLMEIAKTSGLIEQMTKGIAPFIHFLFPRIPLFQHLALKSILSFPDHKQIPYNKYFHQCTDDFAPN